MEAINPNIVVRSAEFKQFGLDVIDGRQEIMAALKEHAPQKSVTLRGYSRDDLRLPSYLGLQTIAGGIPGRMDFEATSVDSRLELDRIRIEPSGERVVTLNSERGIFTLATDEGDSPLPSDALQETLYSLFPENVRYKLTVDKALEVIEQLSPESSVTYIFQDDQPDFLSTVMAAETETINDSVFSLEVSKTIIHPSGKLLVTRMNLSESIRRQANKEDITRNAMVMDLKENYTPVIELSFETLSSEGRPIALPVPTKRHIEDILDVLGRLNEHGLNPSNTGAA